MVGNVDAVRYAPGADAKLLAAACVNLSDSE